MHKKLTSLIWAVTLYISRYLQVATLIRPELKSLSIIHQLTILSASTAFAEMSHVPTTVIQAQPVSLTAAARLLLLVVTADVIVRAATTSADCHQHVTQTYNMHVQYRRHWRRTVYDAASSSSSSWSGKWTSIITARITNGPDSTAQPTSHCIRLRVVVGLQSTRMSRLQSFAATAHAADERHSSPRNETSWYREVWRRRSIIELEMRPKESTWSYNVHGAENIHIQSANKSE